MSTVGRNLSARERRSRRLRFHDAVLSQTFESLAEVLLRLGLNAPHAEALLRTSFVHAAEAIAKARGLRASQSQIAALAGLNRIDVRRLLKGELGRDIHANAVPSRIERLLMAWRNEPEYLDQRGRPRPLKTKGSKSEFARLVRKYGKDVTTRAIQAQLIQMGLAKERSGQLTLLPSDRKRTAEVMSARSDLRFLQNQIRSLNLRIGRRAYETRSAVVPVADGRSALRLQNATLEKIQLMLTALDALTHDRRNAVKMRTKSAHRVIVTATVATESWRSPYEKE